MGISDLPANDATQPATSGRRLLLLATFTAAIFVSAALLFMVQPMFTKMVLPRLGGAPSVWSVAIVFFQGALLVGYAYAHWLTRYAPGRASILVHLVVTAAAVFALPLSIATGWARPPEAGETLWLMGLFAASIGLPFFALAANSPLLQAWFARTDHPAAKDPYFLYAASNIGSFLALVSYPSVIEPFVGLRDQAKVWSLGFGLLIALLVACGVLLWRSPDQAATAAATDAADAPPTWRNAASWVALAAVPSGLLVAVTAHISTDVAAVPLLWVLPLALYLLTFVIVFARRPMIPHWLVVAVQPVFVIGLVAVLIFDPLKTILGLVAPYVFDWVAEYPILLALALLCRPGLALPSERGWRILLFGGLAAAALILIVTTLNSVVPSATVFNRTFGALLTASALFWRAPLPLAAMIAFVLLANHNIVEQAGAMSVRSFFGVTKVSETPDGQFRLLQHGTTLHGGQRIREFNGTEPAEPPELLMYYWDGSAISQAFDAVRARVNGPIRFAVIGLGAGSLACRAEPGDTVHFYEIDPAMIRIARDPYLFSFLWLCRPVATITLGDARLTLADAPDGAYDLLVVDAFSSDAIPIHLMTREAMAMYT